MNELNLDYENAANKLRAFWPYSAGQRIQLLKIALEGIEIFPQSIGALIEEPIQPISIENLDYSHKIAQRLKVLFDRHGSDKASTHEYHKFYSLVFKNRIHNVFEIGLGSNNVSIPSNMGESGKPGASLRAFRDYSDDINVFGADIDSDILFTETRIETRFLNQLDLKSFQNFIDWLPPLDLFIDDGLHSFPANLNSLVFALRTVKPGGWIIIEDIHYTTFPLWQVVAELLIQHDSYIVTASKGASLFAMQKEVS